MTDSFTMKLLSDEIEKLRHELAETKEKVTELEAEVAILKAAHRDNNEFW